MKIIDLSLPLFSGMPVFPGDPEASIELVQTIEKDGWDMRRLQINSHDRTHVDVPSHCVKSGKSLADYSLSDFCGPAKIHKAGVPMLPEFGYIFRDQKVDEKIAEEIKRVRPRFYGMSEETGFELEVERDLLRSGIISFERLCNLDQLPDDFTFFGMPLPIRDGDGSPVRAFAII